MAAAKEPASIRYKNPGAMWGSALAIKWGALPKAVTLNDGKGQGNNIAVFPTYVAGICAQLDLWRTSSKYKNKRFADAIAIWSGGNEVESYISFVTKRVPGMTRDTVMNDVFWKSEKGIAFLKAQAWHEAGRQYPAPDEDWIEAQRRVFGVSVSAGATMPQNVQAPSSAYSAQIETAQRCLDKLGYHEIGEIDGRWGGKTKGALTAFLNDRGIKNIVVNGGMTPAIEAALSTAVNEGWTRPVSLSRATATAQDIAPKVEAVKQSLLQRLGAQVFGWFGVAGAATTGAAQNFASVNEKISPVKEYFAATPGWVWFALVACAALIVYLSATRAQTATVADYNTGKIN